MSCPACFKPRDAGYLVDDQRILRGTEALKRLLAEEQELSRRADWLLTLSDADPKAAAKPLEELYRQARPSGPLRAGVACLALAQTRRAADLAMARTVAQDLERQAPPSRAALAFWTDEEGGYSLARRQCRCDRPRPARPAGGPPQLAILPSAVRWLMANRRRAGLGNAPRTSAEVVLALAKYHGTDRRTVSRTSRPVSPSTAQRVKDRDGNAAAPSMTTRDGDADARATGRAQRPSPWTNPGPARCT